MKKVKKLGLLTVFVVAAITSLPAVSYAEKLCSYQYYYDAAHTQWAGYCHATSCTQEGYWCMGHVTEHYARVDCVPYCDA